MTFITNLTAPELTEAKNSLRAQFLLKLIFNAKQNPSDIMTSRLFMALLVIVDKASREYVAGRESLITYIGSTNKTSLFIEGLGRYETCIVTLKRAYRLLDRLKSQPESPVFNRLLRKLIENREQSVTDIRNAIEHMDEKIINNEFADGEAHILSIDNAGEFLVLASHKLAFIDVHCAIKNLHLAGLAMIEALSVE